MPSSQETAQNFEKHVLQKCLRIAFYTYMPVNLYHFLKKPHNRSTLLYTVHGRALVLQFSFLGTATKRSITQRLRHKT
jgi:hypothetical protein